MDFEPLRRWLAPILDTSILLVVLFIFFPFGSGYLTINRPFGPDLWSRWTTVSPGGRDFSYCPFVLLLGAYLIFSKRFELIRAPLRGNTAAIFWIILGIISLLVFTRIDYHRFYNLAIPILLLALAFLALVFFQLLCGDYSGGLRLKE